MASKCALDILASTAINDRCNQLTKENKQITHENEVSKRRLIDVTKEKEKYRKLWESSSATCDLQQAIISKFVSEEKEHNDKIITLKRQFQNQLKSMKQKYEAERRNIIEQLSKCKQENKSLADNLWETEHTNKALVDEVEELREQLDKSRVKFESIDI